MVEKRFINEGNDIFQYGRWYCSAGGEHCADVIATALNELCDENEQLKHELHTLTGLYAFDKLGKGVKASDDSVTVPRKDLIKLDYGDVE